MNYKLVLFLASLSVLVNCTTTGNSERKRIESKDLIKIESIEIEDPLILNFVENRGTDSAATQSLLVSKKNIIEKKYSDNIEFKKYYFSNGYLFFTPKRFSCLLGNINDEEGSFNNLSDLIRENEKEVIWNYSEKDKQSPKIHKGWEYNEIYSKNFLTFLVKGSVLKNCQSIDEINLNDYDNLYFKIIIPVPGSSKKNSK